MAVVKGAIFDLDGTLLDTDSLWEDIDREFLSRRGIAMPSDYPSAVSSMSFRAAAEYTKARFSLPDAPDALMAEWNEMSRYAYGNTVRLYPGCWEYLEEMRRRGIRLAVATDLDRGIAEAALLSNGILGLFDGIVTTTEAVEDKRSPKVFIMASRLLGLRCGECIVYEDLAEAEGVAVAAGFMTMDAASFHSECLRLLSR